MCRLPGRALAEVIERRQGVYLARLEDALYINILVGSVGQGQQTGAEGGDAGDPTDAVYGKYIERIIDVKTLLYDVHGQIANDAAGKANAEPT